MNKENILFGVVGLLGGLIIGFLFANSVNRNSPLPGAPTATSQSSNVPGGHPDIAGNNPNSDQQMGNVPEVQASIDKAKKEPDNFDAQLKAAEMFYQIERYDGAIEYLLKANKIKPDNYEVIVQLGNSYFDANKFEEAEKWYTNALNIKPDDVNIRTDLGLTFVLRPQPNYDRAVLEFNKSLSTDPKHVKTLQNLIVTYTKKGDAANAKATLKRLEDIDANNSAIAKLRDEVQKIGG